MFAATGLLGARGGILAGITAVVTYIVLYIWSEPINRLNELAPEVYEGMFFLSFVSAVAYCAAMAGSQCRPSKRNPLKHLSRPQ